METLKHLKALHCDEVELNRSSEDSEGDEDDESIFSSIDGLLDFECGSTKTTNQKSEIDFSPVKSTNEVETCEDSLEYVPNFSDRAVLADRAVHTYQAYHAGRAYRSARAYRAYIADRENRAGSKLGDKLGKPNTLLFVCFASALAFARF